MTSESIVALMEGQRAGSAPPLPRIAVVIPAYRAEPYIAEVIRSVPGFVRDIVVVDDASPDGLAGAVEALRDPRVTLIAHPENRGVGAAVFTGYEKALALGAEIVVKLDADGQMDPAYLLPLILPILQGEADYTKGNRFLHPHHLRAMPRGRLFGNASLSFLTKIATGYWTIFDPTNGYTAIHASVARTLERGRLASRYFFESSMLIELSRLRAVVHDVYIPAVYRGEVSSLSKRHAVRDFPLRLLGATVRRILRHYFVRDFTAASLYILAGTVLVAFGAIWGIWHWVLGSQAGVPATTGTVMIAILPIILGTQLLLQAITLDIQGVPDRPIHPSLRLLEDAHQRHR